VVPLHGSRGTGVFFNMVSVAFFLPPPPLHAHALNCCLLLILLPALADMDGCPAGSFHCDHIANAHPGTCQDVPAPGVGFTCSCHNQYEWVHNQTACVFVPTCAKPGDGAAEAFACPEHHMLNTSALDERNPSEATCCQFVPSCVMPIEGSPAFVCPTGYTLNSSTLNATSPEIATCCQFVPTCGFYNESGSSYPCPPGYVLDSSKISAASPNDTRCCKTPALGECEVPPLQPVIYSPRGRNGDLLNKAVPMLIVFTLAESRQLYCPSNNCTVHLARLPMFSVGAAPVSDSPETQDVDESPQVFISPMVCFDWNALACEVGVPLGTQEGRWSVALLPAVNSTDMFCDRTTLLQPVISEVCNTAWHVCMQCRVVWPQQWCIALHTC
jgi:hypothetical protein